MFRVREDHWSVSLAEWMNMREAISSLGYSIIQIDELDCSLNVTTYFHSNYYEGKAFPYGYSILSDFWILGQTSKASNKTNFDTRSGSMC